jgi:flagellin
MSRINTNVAALTAQRGLHRSQKGLNDTLQRLSTGLRINRGADDPAGLIASEGLRSEISGISQAIDNSERAANVIATAEGALSEVASLLLSIKSLVVEAANTGALSPEEIQANQIQVDSAIESITRIANATTFAGLKLVNGSLDYITSGVTTTDISSLRVTQANFGTAAFQPVEVNVITSAKTAELQYQASAVTGGPLTLEVRGNEGVETLSFTGSAGVSAILFAVNQVRDATGVQAEYINSANPNSGITFNSTDYGSSQFVAVRAQSGAFATVDELGNASAREVGQDAVATINGAQAVADGRNISLNTVTLDVDLKLSEAFGIGTTSFAITGGGATFQLGPQVSTAQQVGIAIQSIAATALGDDEVGFLNNLRTGGVAELRSDPRAASDIIETAIRQVATLRGRLGAFERNTLETNVNSLQVALENVTSSESIIRDADFAAETAALTRAQILTQAGTSVLATANTTPQNVLSLLQ